MNEMTSEQAIEILRSGSRNIKYDARKGLLFSPKYVRAVELAEKTLRYRQPVGDDVKRITNDILAVLDSEENNTTKLVQIRAIAEGANNPALQAMSDGWIPTEERLPTKDDADADGFVMIHCADWHATGIDKYTRVDDGLTTHWRRMPQPPEGT